MDLHTLQRLGALAAIGSFIVAAFVIAPLAFYNFANIPSREDKRREALIQELFNDYFFENGLPMPAAKGRLAAESYINERLIEAGETFRYDGKTGAAVSP